ncbi:hypothetical protein [Alteribacter natronophilus]|uniref:hypothetical protein n=1 Tax=Alteribacter natronophilus TaxID=2583810 RepID=UPI00110EEF9C|nr:hypothetical protein [Alteribacter natronophilus]TMW70129.1 hypothetical protein FGB90_18350 [Alteribacter natronophilus]
MKRVKLSLAAVLLGGLMTGCLVDDEEHDAGDQSDVADPGGDSEAPDADDGETDQDQDEDEDDEDDEDGEDEDENDE